MMKLEDLIQADLHHYLQAMGEVDERMPDAPDLHEKWQETAEAYLPDGMREFAQYPTVSLGWMMYTGMAMAQMWDADWDTAAKMSSIYTHLRDQRGYDCMDEYIRQEVLGLQGTEYDALERLVAECASRTNNLLMHQPLQPGTKEAFEAYVSALHQMFLMGIAVQLKRLGYRMQRMDLN